jgi:predicted outer membrane protein
MIRTLFTLAVTAVLCTPAFGQLIKSATEQEVSQAVDTAGRMGMTTPEQNDRRIIRWLAVDNRMMVEAGRLAADKSASEPIKQFARTVAADHERHWAAVEGTELQAKPADKDAAAADANAKRQVAALVRDEGQTRDGAMMFRPTDFVAVKERICNRMHDQMMEQFEDLDGGQFDRAFLTHMTFAHEGLLATIEAVDDNASEKLQPHLKAMHEMAERHLAEVRTLSDQFKSAETVRRAEPTEKK